MVFLSLITNFSFNSNISMLAFALIVGGLVTWYGIYLSKKKGFPYNQVPGNSQLQDTVFVKDTIYVLDTTTRTWFDGCSGLPV